MIARKLLAAGAALAMLSTSVVQAQEVPPNDLLLATLWTQRSVEYKASALTTFDTWEIGGGADVAGPRFGSRPIMLRAGTRWRELPFGVGTSKATEFELGGGLGIQLPFERATADVGVKRASRSAAGATESAWILSLGVSVRP